LAEALGDDRGTADAIRTLAASIAPDLEGLPGVIGHGDFWHGNLLLRPDGRLAGVIDWDAGGEGALPLAYLLHLVVAARVPRGSTAWGAEVANVLSHPEPPSLVARHARTVGLPLDPAAHKALVTAYWLDRLATQVATYADRVARPRWLEANIAPVLRAWKAVPA
jgi:aminoglycoside phosphotransferase (APT) family kinase protein